MELYAIKFGESLLFSKYAYRDISTDEQMQIAWSYYLARYNNKTILFDVGFRDPTIAEEWNINFTNVAGEVSNLFDLSQVDIVFITHSHFDHIDNIDLFQHATIIISHNEYTHVMQNGKQPVRERLLKDNVITVKDEYILDNTFKFKVIGGHTVGSAVIYFTENDTNYVITGDECYTATNLLENRPIGVYANTEKNEAFISEALIQGYTPLPFHDISLYSKYKKVSTNIVQII